MSADRSGSGHEPVFKSITKRIRIITMPDDTEIKRQEPTFAVVNGRYPNPGVIDPVKTKQFLISMLKNH